MNSIFKKWDWGDMNRIDVATAGDRWQALVPAVMNSRVPQGAGYFLTS